MSRLVKEYQKPDGELDADNAEEVAGEIRNCLDETGTGAPVELVDSVVGNLQELGGGEAGGPDDDDADDAPDDDFDTFEYDDPSDVGAGEQTVSGNKIDIGARIKVHHICRGWEDKKRIDADENGTAELNVALDRRGLLPTVWGRLDHCRLKRSETEVELTGTVRIHFGTSAPRVGLKLLKEIGYLVEFDGRMKATRADEEIDIDTTFSFWVFKNRQIQMKVTLPDGTNVVLVLDRDTLQPISNPMLEAGLRTRDANWACEFNLDAVKGSCVDATSADSVVTW